MQTSPRFRRVAALLMGLALVGCQTPMPQTPPVQSENVAGSASTSSEMSVPSNAPSLGSYANVIRSYGAVPDGHKVIRLSEDVLKKLPLGVERSGAEPRGTIVLPDAKNKERKLLDHYTAYLSGTPVPEPYNFRARMGANVGFIYGEGSWWRMNVYGRDVGCTAQANQVIGQYFYWWAAGSTGQWWLLSTTSYSSACPLSGFDPVAVGAAGSPPSATPTPAPTPTPDENIELKISLDDQEVFDGKNNVFSSVNNVVPVIKIKLEGLPSGYNAVANTTLKFSPRKDGSSPTFDRGNFVFDEASKTLGYRVPPQVDQLLVPGDQWIETTFITPSGKVITHKVPITIGEKTLLGGVPGLDAPMIGYKVLQTYPNHAVREVPRGEEIDAPLPEPYNDTTKYTSVALSTLAFFAGASTLEATTWAPPAKNVWLVFEKAAYDAAMKAGSLSRLSPYAYVLFGGASDSLTAFVNNKGGWTHVTPKGTISTTTRTWNNLREWQLRMGEEAMTVSKSTIALAVEATRNQNGGNFELWTSHNGGSGNLIEIYQLKDRLYTIKFEASTANEQEVSYIDIPGLAWEPLVWPTQATFKNRQWGDVTRQIMRYRPDYDVKPESRRRIWGHNWKPSYTFRDPKSGNISDVIKPYEIGGDNGMYGDLLTNHAVLSSSGNRGAFIATQPPKFRNEATLRGHFNDHGVPEFGFLSEESYQFAAQEMLHLIQNKDYYRRGRVPTTNDGEIGDICVYDRRSHALAVWGASGFIRTYHKLGRGNSGWNEDSRPLIAGGEATRPY